MNTIKQFLAANKISAHSIAALWIFLVGAYSTVPAFHSLVSGYYSHLPNSVTQLVAGVAPVVVLYWHSRKAQ